MKLYCPDCKSKDITDLTEDVEDNGDFVLNFKKFIYCPQCDKYKFLGIEARTE